MKTALLCIFCILVATNNTEPKYRLDMHKCTHRLPLHTTSPENRTSRTYVSLKNGNEDKIWKGNEMSKKKWFLNLKITLLWDYTCQNKSELSILERECETNIYIHHQKCDTTFSNYQERLEKRETNTDGRR